MLEIRWNMYALFTFQSPQEYISLTRKKGFDDPKNLTHTDAQLKQHQTQTLFARFYNININNKHFIITHTIK